jgi:hypothetical protein
VRSHPVAHDPVPVEEIDRVRSQAPVNTVGVDMPQGRASYEVIRVKISDTWVREVTIKVHPVLPQGVSDNDQLRL